MSSGAAPSAAGAPRNLVLATVGFALNFWAWALLGPLAPVSRNASGVVGAAGGLGGFVPR